jgi:type IV secretion system protein VirB4
MLGNAGRHERDPAPPYLPYLGHITPNVVLLEDGSLLAMAELHGLPHELSSNDERNAAARMLNSLWRNIASDTVTLYAHFIRDRQVADTRVPHFRNRFAAELDREYREKILQGQLWRNSWFLSLVVSPRNPIGGVAGAKRLQRRRIRRHGIDDGIDPSRMDELWTGLQRSLESYDLRRLGLRSAGPVMFSEIAETLRLILTGESVPVPLVSGRLGNALYTDRAIFGRYAYEIRTPRGPRYGAIFGFREYPARTWPGMLDPLLTLLSTTILTQSFGFMTRGDAISKLTLKKNQMLAANDRATSQIQGLADAQDQVASGDFVMGMHHLSVAVYADDFGELERLAATARGELANCGAVVAQESLGMEAAYFAQLPGNFGWRTRPGAISSRNFSHLANFAAFPRGQAEGRWGPAMMRFKTTASTTYDFIPHVDDVGMTAVFGRVGGGKSTFLMFLLAMFDQYLVEHDGIIVFFDKDRGGELLVRAVDGTYLAVRSGEASGLAPLRGLDDTPPDRAFLLSWLKALIQLDGHGPILSDDEGRLSVGIDAIMRKPVKLRSIGAVRQFLGWRNPQGAGARLNRWCQGGSLGWAFDGAQDEVDLVGHMIGFDLTAILGNPEVVNPAAQYLLYRIGQVIDGRRAVISLDECRAYLLHEQFRAQTEDFLLRGRKNNAVVILVTQEPEHLLGGVFGRTMVEQCFTKVFFRNPTASRETHVDVLELSEGEYRAIHEDMLPGSRQCLIKRDSGSVIVDFDLSAMPDYVAVLSGRATTVRFAERLRAEGSDDWVSEFMRRRREAVD